MELGEEATGSTRHASQYTVTSPATVMDEDTQPVLDSSPVVEQEMKRTLEHDSLVTVRLSEPPSLETERNTGTSPVASRTSIQGEDYGDVELGTGQQGKEENATQVSESQDMGNTDHVGNLQDELEADDGVGMLIDTMDDTAMDLGDVDDDSASDMAGSRSSEDTNWDQLQKIEDEESRDQDNVSNSIWCPLILGSCLTTMNHTVNGNVTCKIGTGKQSPGNQPEDSQGSTR